MTMLRDVGYTYHKKYDVPLVERMLRTWKQLAEDGYPIQTGLKERFSTTPKQILRAAASLGIDTSDLPAGGDR